MCPIHNTQLPNSMSHIRPGGHQPTISSASRPKLMQPMTSQHPSRVRTNVQSGQHSQAAAVTGMADQCRQQPLTMAATAMIRMNQHTADANHPLNGHTSGRPRRPRRIVTGDLVADPTGDRSVTGNVNDKVTHHTWTIKEVLCKVSCNGTVRISQRPAFGAAASQREIDQHRQISAAGRTHNNSFRHKRIPERRTTGRNPVSDHPTMPMFQHHHRIGVPASDTPAAVQLQQPHNTTAGLCRTQPISCTHGQRLPTPDTSAPSTT